MVAVDVAGHEAQAGHADAAQVEVVAQLPGAFLGVGEVVHLQVVGQVRIAAVEVGHRAGAVHPLPAGAERVAALGVGEQQAEGAVVDLAGAGRAGVLAVEPAQVGAQLAGAELPLAHGTEVALAIDVAQAALGVLQQQAVVDLVVELVGVEAVAGGVAGVAFVLAVQADVLGVAGVPRGVALQAGGGEPEPGDLLAGQLGAVEQGRQQASVVVFQQRHVRQHRPVPELCLREAHLAGNAGLGVLVDRATRIVAAGRQQAAVAVRGAGVELDPEHRQGIHAEAQRALGIARAQVEDEALRGFLALGGALRVGRAAVAEVAVEVDGARFQARAAVLEEGGRGRGDESAAQGEGAQAAKGAGRTGGKRGGHAVTLDSGGKKAREGVTDGRRGLCDLGLAEKARTDRRPGRPLAGRTQRAESDEESSAAPCETLPRPCQPDRHVCARISGG
ncbi:hypothetical protein PA99_5000 [Pseudomonas aeruginosa PA99]|nr:hypothetical protein PA99_5000 [Pseudomonas aeruginosa PA99]